MKNILLIACIILFSLPVSTFGQQIGETDFSLGISKTTSTVAERHWEEEFPPTYLIFNATRSWYSDKHGISLRKELGLNLQYAPIKHGSGGALGGSNYYTGNIVSLFANAALMVNFPINRTLALGIGPEAEFLIIGSNNLKNEYSRHNPPYSGVIRERGINRDYFDQPSYGIKARLFDSGIIKRATLGLAVSYLWTNAEASNFYAKQYTRMSLFIGLKNKKEVIPESQNGQQIGETDFALGISQTISIANNALSDGIPPAYFKFNATRSWYSDNQGISLRKEFGLNLQYAPVSQGGGSGMGQSSYLSGNIVSLFANAALLANIPIKKTFALGIGPEAEFLIIGSSNLIDSWYAHYNDPPLSSITRKKGINRDYFDQPSFGIKARLSDSGIIKRTTLSLAVSYLWTHGEISNFYATSYGRISLFIGLKNKKELIPDSQN